MQAIRKEQKKHIGMYIWSKFQAMEQDSRPITNLEQAKHYFIQMGCSHFHLHRELPQRSEEYHALHISHELEDEWRREEFERQLAQFKSVDPKDIIWSYTDLCDLTKSQPFYMEHMLQITRNLDLSASHDEIGIVLNAIVGNNGSKTHGGLIEKAVLASRRDLAIGFADYVKSMIARAENDNIPLSFAWSNFADVIKHFNLKESPAYVRKLIRKGHEQSFDSHKTGAAEGNIYSMRMLAQHYLKGWACKKDIKQAKFWLSKAAEQGNELAKKELARLKYKFWL